MEKIRKEIRKILLEHYFKEDTDNMQTTPLNIIVKESDRNDIWKIRQELISRGFSMYIVGGAVRDAIKNAIRLQKNPHDTNIDIPKDFDLATDAHPNEIKAMFENAPFVSNMLTIGDAFAIQFIVTKSGNKYELATFRSDVGGGRKPDSVQFEKDPKKDAERRDLTINALYYRIDKLTASGFDGEVIDYVGGVADIKNNIINTVGNPQDRFSEDPLRKSRTIRFAAKMDSEIPKNVADAIRDGETSLSDPTGKKVSGERIKDEFYKGIKSSKSVVHFLNLLIEFDFFKHIFGNLNVDHGSFVEERHPLILVANLIKKNDKIKIESVLNSLKYSGEEIKFITFLISLIGLDESNVRVIKNTYKNQIKNSKPAIINEKEYKLTEKEIYNFADLNNIDKIKIKNMIRLANEFPINVSTYLFPLGFKPGLEMGTAIERLENEFYKNPDKVKMIFDSGDAEEIKKIIFINKS